MRERSEFMNSNELKSIIESARISNGVSQRELAKLSGINRSTLNDIINGKIKKVDVDSLKKIAETLDLSLTKLLEVAGYNEFLNFLSSDKYKNKSTNDLKEIIEKYKKSELDLLDFDAQKRKKVRIARQQLFNTVEHLKIMKENKDSLYTIDKAIEEIKFAFDELLTAEYKYDYSKLPKDMQVNICLKGQVIQKQKKKSTDVEDYAEILTPTEIKEIICKSFKDSTVGSDGYIYGSYMGTKYCILCKNISYNRYQHMPFKIKWNVGYLFIKKSAVY